MDFGRNSSANNSSGRLPWYLDRGDDGAIDKKQTSTKSHQISVPFAIAVTGIAVIVVLIVFVLRVWKQRKSPITSNNEIGKEKTWTWWGRGYERTCRGRGYRRGNPELSAPVLPIRQAVLVTQREVKNTVCYDQLGEALDSFFGHADWKFATPIYWCTEHGAKGLFELEFQMWASGKRLLLCHNPVSDEEQPMWEFIVDACVVADEDKMIYKATVSSLCSYCVVAYGGKFKERLVVLPFVSPAPDNPKTVSCKLFFNRDQKSTDKLDELVKECCQSVNSGEGAVLCKPIPTVTVKNSQLFVKCLVPENLSNCLQISIPDREKVLTIEQLRDLHEEHRTGPALHFVMELTDYPKAGSWPIFQLSFWNCQGEDLGSHTIFCPPFCLPRDPPNCIGPASPQQLQRGTLLSNLVRTVYQCDPGMFHKYWKEIAGSHAWQYVLDDIGRIEADASGLKRNCGEQLLHDLAEYQHDVTVEKLAAVVNCMGPESFSNVIKRGTLEAGWPFDDELYRDLVKGETSFHNCDDQDTGGYAHILSEKSDTSVSIGPVPSSPPQSMIHTHSSSSTPTDDRTQAVPIPREPHPAIVQSHPAGRSSEMEMHPLFLRNSCPIVARGAGHSHSELSHPGRVNSRLDVHLHLHLLMGVYMYSTDDDEALNTFS